MPEVMGTHHSKMMILFRHDDTSQVIIHTANMIPKDWTNMTNAVWRSPLLPLLRSAPLADSSTPDQYPLGSGERFKLDLLNYLRAYDRRKKMCRPLVEALAKHDFSAVRAALVASVPGRHHAHDTSGTSWGWSALKRTLSRIPALGSEIVVQISSIATLGGKDDWLRKTLFASLDKNGTNAKPPTFKIVFPTADEIRQSLDGYSSGGSIHTKIQSQQQAKQLEYLRPVFHHWANDSGRGRALPDNVKQQDGGRARAAPHIKTYIRYNTSDEDVRIDWAMLTSANVSKQAWGEAMRPTTGEFRISSWEIGVLIWPDLFEEGGTLMIPTFKTDAPKSEDFQGEGYEGKKLVGVRVPYNFPLQPYGSDEIPWVASMAHMEPDRFGNAWGV